MRTLGWTVTIIAIVAVAAALYFRGQAEARDVALDARGDTIAMMEREAADLERRLFDAETRAELQLARLDSLRTAAERRDRELEGVADSAAARAVDAGRSFAETMDSIRVVIPEPYVELVDAAEAQAEERDRRRVEQVEAERGRRLAVVEQLAAADSAMTVVLRREASKDELLASYRERLGAQMRQIAALERRLDPPFFEGLSIHAGKYGTGAAVGAALACVFLCGP